jgi:hypothetical protein
MTIERPMFPPRAESVDSFSPQPAIGQREGESRPSESRKPAEGLSRRNLLGAMAAVPVVGIPMAAAEPQPDPAFARIAEKLAADGAHGAAIDAQDEAESGDDPDAAEEAFQRCCVACSVVNEADWRLGARPDRVW